MQFLNSLHWEFKLLSCLFSSYSEVNWLGYFIAWTIFLKADLVQYTTEESKGWKGWGWGCDCYGMVKPINESKAIFKIKKTSSFEASKCQLFYNFIMFFDNQLDLNPIAITIIKIKPHVLSLPSTFFVLSICLHLLAKI